MTITLQLSWYLVPLAFFLAGCIPFLLSRKKRGLYKNEAIAAVHCLIAWTFAAGFLLGLVLPGAL